MDFTGPVGRVVNDPLEAMAIEAAEGHVWKKRWRRPLRGNATAPFTQGKDAALITHMPWYHHDLPRDKATAILTKCTEMDG